MIAIIDYGVGNLYSLSSSLKNLNIDTIITKEKSDIEKADKIILPGVGAFEDAIFKLRETNLIETIFKEVEKGKPLLGICLGMQLLFEKSYEYGEHSGLGLIKGHIGSISSDLNDLNNNLHNLKVPHIGWNKLEIKERGEGDPIFKYFNTGGYVYYVHSFYAKDCYENTIASSNYDLEIPGVVKKGNIYGTQFHPEKSGEVGLGILKAFSEEVNWIILKSNT